MYEQVLCNEVILAFKGWHCVVLYICVTLLADWWAWWAVMYTKETSCFMEMWVPIVIFPGKRGKQPSNPPLLSIANEYDLN